MKAYSAALNPAIARLPAFLPSAPGPPYRASDSRHSAIPAKPITSSHNRAAPNGVFPTTRTAPLWSALWPELPKAIWMARMPMMTYITPRAPNPARASQSTYLLLPARRAAYLASLLLRRADLVTTVAPFKTPPHGPRRMALNGGVCRPGEG